MNSPPQVSMAADHIPQAIVELLYSLPEDACFQVGMDQILKVQSLLISLAAQGALPEDPQRLCYLIAPVVCTTPAEQADFYRRFQEKVLKDPEAAVVQKVAATDTNRQVAGERRRLHIVAAVGGFVLLLPTIWLNAPQFQLASKQQPPVKPELPPSTRIVVPVEEPPNPDLRVTVLSPSTDKDEKSDDLKVVAGLIPPPGPTWYWEWIGYFFPIVVGGTLLVGVKKWQQRRAMLFLERQQTVERPSILATASLEVGRVALFRHQEVTTVARHLRKRASFPSTRLDVDATVERTAMNGGRFTPRHGTRHLSPEYVVLVERQSSRDHLANLIESFLTRLDDEEVHFERYWYVGDLRFCQSSRNNQRVQLEELLNQHPGTRLLVCGRAEAFFDRFTGHPAAWTQILDGWTQRVLMTTDPVTEWGYQEWSLAQTGIVVLPLTLDGISRMSQRFDPDFHNDSVPVQYAPKLPRLIADQMDDWLSPRTPPAELCVNLLEELSFYLGKKRMLWFSACAIYPELTWELTLYLGQKLVPELCTESNIAVLARLPWLRVGWIPDWLRQILIAQLSREEIEQARFAIDSILLRAAQGTTGEGPSLEIAWQNRRWLKKVGQRILQQLPEADPDNVEQHDYVFAKFVEPSGASDLRYSVSGQVTRLLRERMQPPVKRSVIVRALSLLIIAVGLTIPIIATVAAVAWFRGSGNVVSLPRKLDSSAAARGYGNNLPKAIQQALRDLDGRRTAEFVRNMLPFGELGSLAAEDNLDATIQLIEYGSAANYGPREGGPETETAPLKTLIAADLQAIDQFLRDGGELQYNKDKTVATFHLQRRTRAAEAAPAPAPAPPSEPKAQNNPKPKSQIQQTAFNQPAKNIPAQDEQLPDQYAITVRFQLVNGSWRFFDAADQLRRVQSDIIRSSGIQTKWEP